VTEHAFSPIFSKEQLNSALEYIADQADALAREVLKHQLELDTLAVFTQSPEEYAFVSQMIRTYGPVSPFTHGLTLYIASDFTVAGHRITFLGARQPDQGRPEIGYADYPVTDYEAIRDANYPGVQEITTGRNEQLLELRHPGFDVRGYIVRAEDHDDGRQGSATQEDV
jgi:hypothetical protein